MNEPADSSIQQERIRTRVHLDFKIPMLGSLRSGKLKILWRSSFYVMSRAVRFPPPISSFCIIICDRVQRRPLRNDAASTSKKPSVLNFVKSKVNSARPNAINMTTITSEHFWKQRSDMLLEKQYSNYVLCTWYCLYICRHWVAISGSFWMFLNQ